MEINQAWIDQQRQISEIVDMVCEDAPGSEVPLLKQIEKSQAAALDALEASMQREAEKDAAIVRLTAERDAAARDLKWLSNEYKFCVTCKRDNGRGVWDCNDERCDAENHYVWRGLCAAPEGTTDVEHTTY